MLRKLRLNTFFNINIFLYKVLGLFSTYIFSTNLGGIETIKNTASNFSY